ncbi:MAG: response regulator [Ferruginibacter sp.]
MNEPLHIWLIDDDHINNFLTKELINLYCPENIFVEVHYAEAGIQMLQDLIDMKKQVPEIILLDLNMPVNDGWYFIDKFEKLDDSFTQKINLYVYTSSLYFEDINRANSYHSVKKLFSKPLTQENITEIFSRH